MSQTHVAKTTRGVLGFLTAPQGKATIMVALLVLTAGCMGIMDDDTGAPGAEPLDDVPEGVDGVAFFSGQIVQDQATEELMNGGIERMQEFDPNYDGPENWQEALDEFEDESDLRVGGFNSALVFFQEEQGDFEDYGAVIIDSDWSSEEIEDAFEEVPETQEYNGITVWVEEDEFTGEETWTADLGDGTYVIGNSQAVQDAIDTHQGDMASFSGDLRDAYESADDGLMKMAVDIPAEEFQGMDLEVQVMTMTYSTSNSDMTVQAQATMGDEEQAENAQGMINLGLSEFQNQLEMEGEDEIAEMVERVEVEADGNQLRTSYTTNPDEILEVFDEFMMGGMGAGTQFSVQPQVAG